MYTLVYPIFTIKVGCKGVYMYILRTCLHDVLPLPPYKHVIIYYIETRHEKFLVLHTPSCTATEDCQRLEISDLESTGIALSL